MTLERLQRTLIIGLGQAGATTAEAVLDRLTAAVGPVDLVQAVAVLPEAKALSLTRYVLTVEPGTGFESWQAAFEQQAGLALAAISQLAQVSRLAGQGLGLKRPEEIHLIIIAGLVEVADLPHLVAMLRGLVQQRTGSHVSLTGLLLAGAAETEPAEVVPAGSEVVTTPAVWPDPVEPGDLSTVLTTLSADLFDRGCFIAGLTNEAGLVVGNGACLRQRAADFLTLLVRETALAALEWPGGWSFGLTSFGLATVRWPGPALVEALSRRWVVGLLGQLLTGPPDLVLARQAQAAARQLLTGQRLAPPLLLEQLMADLPALPGYLADLAPDPPWPWLVVETPGRLEQATRQWEENWQLARRRLESLLTRRQAEASADLTQWLAGRVGQQPGGAVLTAHSHLAALSELLHAFIEGVEERLGEAEADLAQLNGQISQAAETLATELDRLPHSPLAMGLCWGLHPFRWPAYWALCHRLQNGLRQLGRLQRSRLILLQTAWLYETVLPFYRELLAAWTGVVDRWQTGCARVAEAHTALARTEEPASLAAILAEAGGPWTETTLLNRYQAVVERETAALWEEVGSLPTWLAAGLTAVAVQERLQQATRRRLRPALEAPVDRMLTLEFETEIQLTDWFKSLLEQARPFWRYDETALAETSRAQARLERWCLLPGGSESPLAALAAGLPHAPTVLPSPDPAVLTVVTARQGAVAGEGEGSGSI